MKIFGRDSKKDKQKKVTRDMNVEDMTPYSSLPSQRSLQQPAPVTVPHSPKREFRPATTRRPERQSEPPHVDTQLQQTAVKQQSRQHLRHTVQLQPSPPPPPVQMEAAMRYAEYAEAGPLETLQQPPHSPRTLVAKDPPQVFATSQAPSLKEAPVVSLPKDSVDALKETFGVDPAVQMARNAVTRELVKQFIADVWNRGDLDLIPKICAKGIRFNGSEGMDRVGHDGFKKMVTTIRGYLDDYHCEIHSMVVEGNKAYCRIRFMGRHTGRLHGYEPTGRQVSWMGAMEFTVHDNKIIKVWELGDMASLEQQLREANGN